MDKDKKDKAPKEGKPVAGKVNKWALVNIFLGALLVASVGFNVYFALRLPDDAKKAIDESAKIEKESKRQKASDWFKKKVDEGKEKYKEYIDKKKQQQEQEQTDENEYIPDANLKGQELSEKRIYSMLENYRQKNKYTDWTIKDLKIQGHNANHTIYYVTYTEKNKDGNEAPGLIVIMKYKKNRTWSFELPGASGTNEDLFKKYNLIKGA